MWMKVDDRLHAHRKTRAVSKSHPDKKRDIAPMGLWVAAGSWSAQNGTDGWVPEEELDRWDDDWKMLAARLVDCDYWWVEDRDGEPGYGFHDWHDYNFPTEAASASGAFGNHVRWHEKRGKIDPECEHCPKEPDGGESGANRGAIGGDTGLDLTNPGDSTAKRVIPAGQRVTSGGDIGTRSGGDRSPDRSTQPDPTHPDPIPRGDKSPTSRRSTQIPKTFRPSDKHMALADELRVDLRAEWPKFCDHHISKGSTFKDWDAALRKWIRGAPALSNVRRLPPTEDTSWMDRRTT